MNGLGYLKAQPDAEMLMQMLGLLPTPRPVKDPRKGGRPKSKTFCDKRRQAEHGTYYMYKRHKCRCQPCRAANAANQLDYQRRRAARAYHVV